MNFHVEGAERTRKQTVGLEFGYLSVVNRNTE